MKNKSFTYLLKLNKETDEIFGLFKERLGWNKKETILKLLLFFKELIVEMENDRKLVIQVREEKSDNVVKEKMASFDMMRSPN